MCIRDRNNGIVPQYYVEGNHEAIIPKDIFLRVQEELVRRRVVKTSANGKKRSYSCNHCFAQIVICGECGEMFRRIHWNNRGCKSIVWRCLSRLEPTSQECHARTVNETVLENVVVQAINTLLGDRSTSVSYTHLSAIFAEIEPALVRISFLLNRRTPSNCSAQSSMVIGTSSSALNSAKSR